MRHKDIWRGIDRLADRNGLSASGLARLSGLNATTFNPSKRMAKDGRPRWPSTETLSRALAAVGAGFDDLAVMIEGKRGTSAPMIGFAQAGNDGFFDDAGFPLGDGWDDVRFPGMGTDTVYALEIADDSMEPVYRAGDRIIVSPEAPIRRGDRVVAKTVDGVVVAKVLGRCTETRVELLSFNLSYAPRKSAPDQIAWMARILWASP